MFILDDLKEEIAHEEREEKDNALAEQEALLKCEILSQ